MPVLKTTFELEVGDMLVTNPDFEDTLLAGLNLPQTAKPSYDGKVFMINHIYPGGLIEAIDITEPDPEFASDLQFEACQSGCAEDLQVNFRTFAGGPEREPVTVLDAKMYDFASGQNVSEYVNVLSAQTSPAQAAQTLLEHGDWGFASSGVVRHPNHEVQCLLDNDQWRGISYSHRVIFELDDHQRYARVAEMAGWDLTGELH